MYHIIRSNESRCLTKKRHILIREPVKTQSMKRAGVFGLQCRFVLKAEKAQRTESAGLWLHSCYTTAAFQSESIRVKSLETEHLEVL